MRIAGTSCTLRMFLHTITPEEPNMVEQGIEEDENMVRVAVVEDEKVYSDELIGFIRRYAKEKDILMDIVLFENGMDFDEYIDSHSERFDIVFMDIKMPYVNGLSSAKHLRACDPYVSIIFTTVMMQYATRGYEVDALDYMVKPIRYLNLSIKLDKAMTRIVRNKAVITLPAQDGGLVRVPASDIYYVESQDHYCLFHTKQGDMLKLISLSTVEETLREEGFLRCSNSFLINPVYVTRMTNTTIVIREREISISRRKHKEFMQEIARYF